MKERIRGFQNQYSFLSNFYRCEVVVNGIKYPTSEHAFQAMKFITTDEKIAERIRLCEKPSDAKELANEFKKVVRRDWKDVSLLIMEKVVTAKFSQNPDLLHKLLDTGTAELIEDNWWNDTFWGVCKGVGENNLGKILMKVRERLR
jgi:ribA/ribD-fused uncharacterized protein